MVDGIGNFNVVCDDEIIEDGAEGNPSSECIVRTKAKSETIGQQKFDDADLIVLGCSDKDLIKLNLEDKTKEGFGKKECFYYPLWAVYGNTVIESSIHKGNIKNYKKNKIVWAKRKPYILNVDCRMVKTKNFK